MGPTTHKKGQEHNAKITMRNQCGTTPHLDNEYGSPKYPINISYLNGFSGQEKNKGNNEDIQT